MKAFFQKYINNKYFYSVLAFVIWMTFFDQESFIEQYKLSQTLNGLENQKSFYLEEIEKNDKTIETLETDTAALERFAREKYYMKRENEEVYVIVKEE